MNKKQLVAMWIGIAIIVVFGIFILDETGGTTALHRIVRNLFTFIVIVTIVAAITRGLITSLAEKKCKKPEDEQL